MQLPQFNSYDIEQQFLDFLRANGLEPIGNFQLKMDGNLYRYRLEGDTPSERSGAYILHDDGLPAGYAQDWRNGTKLTWCFKPDNIDDEQRAYFNSPEFKKLQEENRIKRENEQKKRQQRAAKDANAAWERMLPVDVTHPYLSRKHVNNYGVRFNPQTSDLIIPLADIKGNVKSLQIISAAPEKPKLFFEGASLDGLFWSIALDTIKNEPNKIILLGEGYATMAKIYELTSLPCVAALSCYRLKEVAQILHKAYPKARIIVMADNDKETELKHGYNPGIRAADELVEAKLAQAVIAPKFRTFRDGTDWDDYAIKYGNEVATKELHEKIAWECLTELQKKDALTRKKLLENIHDLDPRVQLPPQEFIGGIFPRKFVTVLAAPPGTGKTIFLQKFCSDVSTGGTVFDGFAEDEPERKCLILAGEAGYELLTRRAASMKWGIKSQNVKVVDQYEFETKDIPIMLDDKEGFENLVRLVDMFRPDILFIDTFSSFHDRDENKAPEMKPLIKKLAKLARDFNMAVVLVHHSRKRAAKERNLNLNQDDVIGSSIINRLVGLIIGIEPMKDDEKVLLVRSLKSWFSGFLPFTYTLKENLYGGTTMQTDLAPAGVNNSKAAVWFYLSRNFEVGEWFSSSQIILSEIEGNVPEWQLRRILSDFVKTGKLLRRGSKKYLEYSRAKG